MRKKKNKRFSARLRESIILTLEEKLDNIQEKIMARVLAVVLMISIIAATVAWFNNETFAYIKGMFLTTAGTSEVQVSLTKDNWSDILENIENEDGGHGIDGLTGEDGTGTIEISMPAFENIFDKNANPVNVENGGIIAPGTYGSFSFFVKLVDDNYDQCELSIGRVLDMDELAITENPALEEELTKLFQGHILCFGQVEDEDTCQYVDMENPMIVDFEPFTGESEPKKVTVYWLWPYEYTDVSAEEIVVNDTLTFGTAEKPANVFTLPAVLPDSISNITGGTAESGNMLAPNQVFEWQRYNETISTYKTSDDRTKSKMLIDWYDYGDTLLGSYVSSLAFHMQVKGVDSYETP